MNMYSNVLVSVRTLAENLVKDVADQKNLDVDNSTFNDILKRLKMGCIH